MSFKRCIQKDGKDVWVEVAGSGGAFDTGEAVNVRIEDASDRFNSTNVEGALNELSLGLESINNDLINHKNNSNIHGGGGGGSMPTITSDFTITKSDGISPIEIPIFFTSPALGEGIAYVLISNVEVATQKIQQGNNTIKVPPLGAGKNIVVSIYVKDRAGMLSNQLNWTVTSGGISLTMLTDTEASYGVTSRIVLAYTITCMTGEDIFVYFNIDGTEYETKGTNGYNNYEITGLTTGVHKIEYWAISGEYATKKAGFTLIVVSKDTIIISTDFDSEAEYESGIPISIPYRIGVDRNEDFTVNMYINGELNKTVVTRPASLYWTISYLDAGTYTLKIEALNETLGMSNYIEFECKVVQGEYTKVQPVIDGSLLAWFDATERTNSDTDREIWTDKIRGNIGRLYNFNYGSNGWIKQEGKDISELVMNGTCYVEIDMTPFADNFKNGGTIELVFKTRDVGNSGARVLDITDEKSPYKGVYIDTREAYLSTANQSINASIGEDEYIQVMYDIDRINKYCHVIVNGVITKSCKLSDIGSGTSAILESIEHTKKIYLNSKKGIGDFGSCEITHFRIYDRNLTLDEILQNFLSNFDDLKIQKEKSDFNNPAKNIMPIMNITCDQASFDTMTDVNKVEVSMTYTSPNADLYGETLVDATNCLMYWQGTSSVGYNIHNFNLLLRDSNRQEIMYSPYKNVMPQSLFCLKANLMESTNAHNVGLASYVHTYLYSTLNPAQKVDPRVSRAIHGFPFLLYINGVLQGVYDFNLDRFSTKAYGYELEEFKDTCRVYEVSANTNHTAGAFIPWSADSGMDEWTWYKNDFSGIYPVSIQNAINDDFSALKNLITFVHDSTDEVFTTEFATYFDKESVIRYYIFVMTLGLVDSLGKNMKLCTYDGVKWEIQVYDCDTAFGLDNTGALKYDVDIEVDPEHFNTADSVLWSRVRELFWADIVAEYTNMRNGNLTPEKIYECIFTNQIEKIPESQYNFSTQKKYLDTGEYIMMSNGNRYYNLKRWIKERFIYCDTLFNYTPTTARYITLRSGVEGSTYLDIQTYYPMYVTVEWRNQADGSGRQTLKVGRNETVRFNGVVQAKDQEVMIYGAEHLKNLGRMDGFKPRHLLLNNAYRLTSVECPNNTELINIQMEQCSYLQRIDLRGCSSLGSLSSSQVLDVSGCSNLRYLDTYGTIITSINTNQMGGNLVEIYIPKTLQTLSLKNQYSLEIIGLPSSDYLTNSRLRQLKSSASNLASFSLINCPKVKRLTRATSFNINGNFYDKYGNERRNSEISSLDNTSEWNNLMLWGNGLANANEIYIENSCHDITSMSFRCTVNLQYLTLRNLPNLKTVMLGANCNGNRWNNEGNNYQADRLDVKGEFDWENFVIKDCPNIENFYIHEMYSCWDNNEYNNYDFFNFKEGTNSINLAEKFPSLKRFECNLATQNIHQFILPTTLKSFINLSWHDHHDEGYPLEWVIEKYNIDSVYFNGEHTDDYVGVDLGNHAMHDVRITAPYTHEIIGLNIKNEWVNPVFNKYKSDGHETRPSVIPYGKIDVSEFKWRSVSSWFAYIDFTQGNCEIIYPTNWDTFLKNVDYADTMFYHCVNPDFTWEFAMKFFGKINDVNALNNMYAYAQLKEQTDFETDGVEMISSRQAFYYNYNSNPLRGANLKYVKSLTLTGTDGCMGLFRNCTSLIKVGDCTFSGSNNNWYGCGDLFAYCSNLEEVGNITSYRNGENGRTTNTWSMFRDCQKLTKIGTFDLASNNTQEMYKNCTSLTDEGINIPNTSYTTSAWDMFYNCSRLRNSPITDYSSMQNISNMYRQCYNLQTIHLEGIDKNCPLQEMSNTFRDCQSLTSITISGATLPIGLRNMSGVYANCYNLKNVIPIPTDFSYDVNMSSICSRCYSLTDKTIYKEIPYRVTNVQYMYEYCSGLSNPVVNIASDNVYARNMFQYCRNMQTLTVNFNGRLLRNSQYFAQYCDSLQTVNFKFPEALSYHDYYQTGVEYYNMFQYCGNLNYVNLDMTGLVSTNARADFGSMFYQDPYIKEIHGLDLTYLKPFQHPLTSSGQNAYDWHNDSITYGGAYTDLSDFDITGLLNTSYNFRNINTMTHTKKILQHLDTVTNETLGLTYNIMDAIDDELNEYVDPELKSLALDAMSRGWTFIIV